MKLSKLCIGIGLAIILIVTSIFAPAVMANTTGGSIPTSIRDQMNQLLKDYDQALQQELQIGKTVIVTDDDQGTHKMLAEESQQKMDVLWRNTVQKIEALSARPAIARQKAVNLIQTVDPSPVSYVERAHIVYDFGAQLERYRAGQKIYSVDIATNEIIEIRLVDDTQIKTERIFTQDQLEEQARSFIARINPQIDLDKLSPTFGDKSNTYFFFRWEDKSKKLMDRTVPFIQIGFSQSGDFLSYYNTLRLTTVDETANRSSSIATYLLSIVNIKIVSAFSEVYANGGSHWQWERYDAPAYAQDNAGYCYYAGWCSPTNFYYANGNSSGTFYSVPLRGRWQANTNSSSDPAFYIPSTHASALTCYGVWYNGGSSSDEGSKCINQNAYYNTWVELSGAPWYNISKLVLPNTNEGSTGEVAWDEAWVYDHN